MNEGLGPSPEEMGIEIEDTPEEISRESVLEVCRHYQLPPEYLEELGALEDVNELIATASIWIQEEGHDVDEFLKKIGAE